MPKKIDNNLIVGLDIGTSKIVAIVADVLPDNSLDIIGAGSYPAKGMKKGVVVNVDTLTQSIERAVEEAELMTGCTIHNVITSVSGRHIKSLNSNGVVAIRDREITAVDVDKVIEAAKAVALPIDQKILHVLPQEFSVDYQSGIKDPLGMTGVRLETKVHLVTGAISAIQNIVTCLRRCDLEIDELVLAHLAASAAVLTDDEKRLGVCLIDIGSGTTDIVVFINGAIVHTAVIPVAGDQVTNDLAVALRIALTDAEDIKIQYGCADASLVQTTEELEVAHLGAHDTSIINQDELTKIIEPRYDELFTLINNELQRLGFGHKLGAGIVLTGGGAQMLGVTELANKVFNLPVRLGLPTNVAELHDSFRAAQFATGIGLLMHGLQKKQENVTAATEHSFGLHNQGVKEFFGRVKNWFQGNF